MYCTKISVDFLPKNFPPFQVHHAKKPPRFYPDGFQRNVIDFYFIFSDCRLRKALYLLISPDPNRGDGIFPLEEYLGDISATQYTGYLTIELTAAQYYNDPHCAMERTMKALSPYLK